MSKLEELIARLCPDGVEYKSICDIADTFIGLATSVTKYKSDEGVLLLHNSDIKDGKIELKKIEYITEEFAKRNFKKILRTNDVITVHTGDVGTSAVVTQEYDGAIGFTTITSRIKNSKEILPEYLCKYLNSGHFKAAIYSKTISDRSNLNLDSFDKIKVPVPPLEVQREIVHILDSFTLLTAELAAELAARQKQYEWYKRKLIEDASEMRDLFKLKDVASYVKERITTEIINKNNYVGVENLLQDKKGKTDASSIPSTGSVIGFEKDDILLGNIRPYLKKIWFANIEGGTNGDVLAIRANTKFVLPKYLYYILSTDTFFLYDNSHSKGAKMPRGNKDAIMDYEFLLPPLSEQQRIVDILDRFDALCNDITSGLPAEIEARRKQYEYYRDKLLTFKELKKEA